MSKPLHIGASRGQRGFRFCRMPARVRGATINANIKHVEEEPAVGGLLSAGHVRASAFARVLELQRELNLTEHYGKFYDRISSVSANAALLVQHRAVVVGTICLHLRRGGKLAVPLLALVPPLALDLQAKSLPDY